MSLPPRDPEHWLYRLESAEWLSAARAELARCHDALLARERRRAVAHARRAAGMALNAVLIVVPRESWGRSYMDHLRAVATESSIPEEVRAAARELLAAPMDAPRLIPLGGGTDDGLRRAASEILTWCEQRTTAPHTPQRVS